MKDVVFVTQTLGMGGAEVFNAELLSWLTKNSCTVEAFCNNDRFLKVLKDKSIKVKKIPLVIDIIGDWKGLVKGLLLLPFGFIYYGLLVLTHSHKTFLMTGYIEKILVTPWARLIGSKVVWIEFGPLDSVLNKFWGIPSGLYKLVSTLPDVVIMSSDHTKKANSHLFKKQIEVIPCAITAQGLHVKSDPNLVICVSRLEPGKGQDMLINAWVKVITMFPKARLKIIGEGDQRHGLLELIENLNLGKSVELAGWVQNSVLEIASGNIVVFPSTWPLEGFGIVAIEAMSQSKPVVGFARGPLPEIIDDNSGILVSPGDTNKLALAIVDLLKHPDLAQKLGKAGKLRFQKLFTWDSVGPRFLQWL